MTADEIIEVYEMHFSNEKDSCNKCPLPSLAKELSKYSCIQLLTEYSFEVIKSLKAENERLNKIVIEKGLL